MNKPSRILAVLPVLVLFGCAAASTEPEPTSSTESALDARRPAPGAKKVCETAIRCAPGYVGVDTDGDSCPDTCEPVRCDIAIRCAPGYVGIDTDGDSCPDTCQPE